jgi:hypothetical protein
MKPGIRFDPPRQELGDELCWLVWRAFGPIGAPLPGETELRVQVLRSLAEDLDLAARIGSRTRLEILEIELGAETARWIQQQHSAAAARRLLVGSVCRELAEQGRSLEIPLIFLKGAALQLAGKTASGARNMSDIDLLAPEDGARELQAALVEEGCEVFEARESEHQLQFLSHRSGLGIEIHKIIPGVRLGGEASATAEDLIARGLVRPVAELRGRCYLPNEAIMLAHLLVHGVAQHGMAPGAYPMSRMLADLQDLEAGDDAAEGAARWIERDVSAEEVEAVVDLVRRLQAGDNPAAVATGDDDAGVLLLHLAAGVSDAGYARSMKFRGLTAKPGDDGGMRALAKTVRGALLPTQAQIDILYGKPKSRLGYWGWRLWRPFDLVLRALRYGTAWLGQKSGIRK